MVNRIKRLTRQLEKAQDYIDLAKAISPNNPEILVHQAMVHTTWVAFDGAKYGMSLSGKVVAIYQKALQIDLENPRVVFSKSEWDMDSAKYFGKDTAPFCATIDRSLELFTNFKPQSEIHPNSGKDRVWRVLKACGQ